MKRRNEKWRLRNLLTLCLAFLAMAFLCACSETSEEDSPVILEEEWEFEQYTDKDKDGIDNRYVSQDPAVTFDGKLDESFWADQRWLEVDSLVDENVHVRMTSYYGTDGLYMAFDVDDVGVFYSNRRSAALNSGIQLYLSSMSGATDINDHAYEIMLTAGGKVQVNQFRNGSYIAGPGTVRTAIQTKGELNTVDCKGYTMEVYIDYGMLDDDHEEFYASPAIVRSMSESGSDRQWYWFGQELIGSSWTAANTWWQFNDKGLFAHDVIFACGEGGRLEGKDHAYDGKSYTFRILPDEGSYAESITVNGEDVSEDLYYEGGAACYMAYHVAEDLRVEASFAKLPEELMTVSGTVLDEDKNAVTSACAWAVYRGFSQKLTPDGEGAFEEEIPAVEGIQVMAEAEGYISAYAAARRDRKLSMVLCENYFGYHEETGWGPINENTWDLSKLYRGQVSLGNPDIEAGLVNSRIYSDSVYASANITLPQAKGKDSRAGFVFRDENGASVFIALTMNGEVNEYNPGGTISYSLNIISVKDWKWSWNSQGIMGDLTDSQKTVMQLADSDKGVPFAVHYSKGVFDIWVNGEQIAYAVTAIDADGNPTFGSGGPKVAVGIQSWLSPAVYRNLEFDGRRPYRKGGNDGWDMSRLDEGTARSTTTGWMVKAEMTGEYQNEICISANITLPPVPGKDTRSGFFFENSRGDNVMVALAMKYEKNDYNTEGKLRYELEFISKSGTNWRAAGGIDNISGWEGIREAASSEEGVPVTVYVKDGRFTVGIDGYEAAVDAYPVDEEGKELFAGDTAFKTSLMTAGYKSVYTKITLGSQRPSLKSRMMIREGYSPYIRYVCMSMRLKATVPVDHSGWVNTMVIGVSGSSAWNNYAFQLVYGNSPTTNLVKLNDGKEGSYEGIWIPQHQTVGNPGLERLFAEEGIPVRVVRMNTVAYLLADMGKGFEIIGIMGIPEKEQTEFSVYDGNTPFEILDLKIDSGLEAACGALQNANVTVNQDKSWRFPMADSDWTIEGLLVMPGCASFQEDKRFYVGADGWEKCIAIDCVNGAVKGQLLSNWTEKPIGASQASRLPGEGLYVRWVCEDGLLSLWTSEDKKNWVYVLDTQLESSGGINMMAQTASYLFGMTILPKAEYPGAVYDGTGMVQLDSHLSWLIPEKSEQWMLEGRLVIPNYKTYNDMRVYAGADNWNQCIAIDCKDGHAKGQELNGWGEGRIDDKLAALLEREGLYVRWIYRNNVLSLWVSADGRDWNHVCDNTAMEGGKTNIRLQAQMPATLKSVRVTQNPPVMEENEEPEDPNVLKLRHDEACREILPGAVDASERYVVLTAHVQSGSAMQTGWDQQLQLGVSGRSAWSNYGVQVFSMADSQAKVNKVKTNKEENPDVGAALPQLQDAPGMEAMFTEDGLDIMLVRYNRIAYLFQKQNGRWIVMGRLAVPESEPTQLTAYVYGMDVTMTERRVETGQTAALAAVMEAYNGSNDLALSDSCGWVAPAGSESWMLEGRLVIPDYGVLNDQRVYVGSNGWSQCVAVDCVGGMVKSQNLSDWSEKGLEDSMAAQLAGDGMHVRWIYTNNAVTLWVSGDKTNWTKTVSNDSMSGGTDVYILAQMPAVLKGARVTLTPEVPDEPEVPADPGTLELKSGEPNQVIRSDLDLSAEQYVMLTAHVRSSSAIQAGWDQQLQLGVSGDSAWSNYGLQIFSLADETANKNYVKQNQDPNGDGVTTANGIKIPQVQDAPDMRAMFAADGLDIMLVRYGETAYLFQNSGGVWMLMGRMAVPSDQPTKLTAYVYGMDVTMTGCEVKTGETEVLAALMEAYNGSNDLALSDRCGWFVPVGSESWMLEGRLVIPDYGVLDDQRVYVGSNGWDQCVAVDCVGGGAKGQSLSNWSEKKIEDSLAAQLAGDGMYVRWICTNNILTLWASGDGTNWTKTVSNEALSGGTDVYIQAQMPAVLKEANVTLTPEVPETVLEIKDGEACREIPSEVSLTDERYVVLTAHVKSSSTIQTGWDQQLMLGVSGTDAGNAWNNYALQIFSMADGNQNYVIQNKGDSQANGVKIPRLQSAPSMNAMFTDTGMDVMLVRYGETVYLFQNSGGGWILMGRMAVPLDQPTQLTAYAYKMDVTMTKCEVTVGMDAALAAVMEAYSGRNNLALSDSCGWFVPDSESWMLEGRLVIPDYTGLSSEKRVYVGADGWGQCIAVICKPNAVVKGQNLSNWSEKLIDPALAQQMAGDGMYVRWLYKDGKISLSVSADGMNWTEAGENSGISGSKPCFILAETSATLKNAKVTLNPGVLTGRMISLTNEDPEASEEVSADGEIPEDPEASEEVSADGEIPEDTEANEEVSADGEIPEDTEANEEVSADGEIPEDTEAGESESQDETAEDPEADAYDGSVGKKEADQAGNGRSTALYGNLKWEKVKANRGVLLSDRSDSGMKSAANRKKSLLETAHR